MPKSLFAEIRDQILGYGAISYIPMSTNSGFFLIKLPGENFTSHEDLGETVPDWDYQIHDDLSTNGKKILRYSF